MYQKKRQSDTEKTKFILRSLFNRLKRLTDKTMPGQGESDWSSYMRSNGYSSEEFSAKKSFVETALAEARPKRILDVGCNIGYFSLAAARQGARVVAIDSDPTVVGETWRQALKEDLDILPLVVNIASPTPGLGWRNRESTSFLERSFGAFDAVMMLAVVHHILVTGQIPLYEIAELASQLTNDLLLIEFVSPQDPLFRSITLGRDYLYDGLAAETFETAFRHQFDIVRTLTLCNGNRSLYVMRKKLH
jgi:SAM-dependent methyltransferase